MTPFAQSLSADIGFTKQSEAKGMDNFEKVMGHLEYSDDKIFRNREKLNYADARCPLLLAKPQFWNYYSSSVV